MAELADAQDLKSCVPLGTYGFEPRSGYLCLACIWLQQRTKDPDFLGGFLRLLGESRGQGHAWMDHRGGRIVVKNPDSAILKKMCSIAEKLVARVQGDEDETDRNSVMLFKHWRIRISSRHPQNCRSG